MQRRFFEVSFFVTLYTRERKNLRQNWDERAYTGETLGKFEWFLVQNLNFLSQYSKTQKTMHKHP